MAEFKITVAGNEHVVFAPQIVEAMAEAAKARGTGIAKRSTAYIVSKIEEGKAVIALAETGELAGFCYIETWDHGKYVANSGLIVLQNFRKSGLAKQIKEKAFELSRQKFPEAKIFGITTSLAVMKINADLGYRPVTFSELTTDEAFWKGCQSCVNYDILTRTERSHCLCTGMVYDPEKEKLRKSQAQRGNGFQERWQQFKAFLAKRGLYRRKGKTVVEN